MRVWIENKANVGESLGPNCLTPQLHGCGGQWCGRRKHRETVLGCLVDGAPITDGRIRSLSHLLKWDREENEFR